MSNMLKDKSKLVTKALNTVSLVKKWLDQNEKAIREIQDIHAHYKACYLHAVTGNPVKSRYYADIMQNRYLRSDGDFRTEENHKGWYSLPCNPANRYVYTNGWIVTGLQRMGAYYPARRGLEFLCKMQDPETGGFYSAYDIAEKLPDTKYVDTSSTSAAGFALLACGQEERAIQAGEFILKHLSCQPELNRYFFSSWAVGSGVRTDVFGDDDQNSVYGRKQVCLDLKGDPHSELIWLLGKPMKFLCRLYELTRDKRYLEGAITLFECFEVMEESKYENLSSCKIMWGGSELYRYTGEEKFGEISCRMMKSICDMQDPSGVWLCRLWYKDLQSQSFAMSLDAAQEMALEITDVIYDLV